jgi:tetratricopeptide (TPR) repeat protein
VAAGTAPAPEPEPAGSAAGAGAAARVGALVQAGIRQAQQKNWAAAATAFHGALAIDPENVYALYDLGVVAQANNDDSHALSYYGQALAANGRYTPAMYNKAILLEASSPRQAIALYSQVIAISPRAATAYLRMAFVEAELGDQAQARVADARAVALDPRLGQYRLPAKKGLGARRGGHGGRGLRRGRLGRGRLR